MPRTSTIRYFDSRKGYYTQYKGKQHLLAAGPKDEPDGPTYKRAVERFAEVIHAGELDTAEDNCLVSAIITRYCYHLQQERRKNTYHQARTLLVPAAAHLGHHKVKVLKPIHVTDWLKEETNWNSTSKHTAFVVLRRAFNWAKEQRIISKSPLAGLRNEHEKRVRGKEVLLPEGLQDLLVALASPEFGKLLRVLRGTGCRPGEVVNAECKHYRPEVAAIVYPWNVPPGEYRWKCAKTTKKDRVIYLPPDLQTLVEGEIAQRGGEGRIFRTERGQPWNGNNLVNRVAVLIRNKRVQEWCAANGFDAKKIMPYGFRHTFITKMLLAGCPIKTVADLCGTSVFQIERTYSHAHEDLHSMRRVFLQFNQLAASVRPRP